jgi:iron(III) transport system ATP-binding protein
VTGVVVKGLTKRYGNVTAVDRLDLTIDEGEFVVLLGPSGCGKTTTLRCIAGLEEISDGTISMGGTVVSSPTRSLPPEQRAIGMVFQSYAVWPHMTVTQNVAFGLKLKKLPTAEIDRRVSEVLELVGLGQLGARGVSQLSGGQQQRVALARAIILEPKVLLFDEPLSNLDAKLRERMRFELRSLQQRLGITSIYVTHDQQEAMVIGDRVVLMNGGRIEQMGDPWTIYHRPATRFAAEFIGLANVLPGQVVSTGPTVVALDNGLRLESDQTEFGVGDRVELVVRPEHVELAPGTLTGPNTFEGRVASLYFLGNLADVTIDVGGISLRCQASPPRQLPTGHPVGVRIAPDQVVLLRGEGPRGTT